MITRFLAVVGRHRRLILVVAVLLSSGHLLVGLQVPSLAQRAHPATSAAVAVFLLSAAVAAAWSRPRAFVVRPRVPAFSTPSHPALLFATLALLVLVTRMVGRMLRDLQSQRLLPDQFESLGWVAVLALWIVVVWRDTGVQLRPEGLWQVGFVGRVVVPWDASPTVAEGPPPGHAATVRLGYGRPELVRRHGVFPRRDRLRTPDIDPRLVTAAIRHYVRHPEHRPAIGTRAEYDRLMAQLLGSPTTTVGRPRT